MLIMSQLVLVSLKVKVLDIARHVWYRSNTRQHPTVADVQYNLLSKHVQTLPSSGVSTLTVNGRTDVLPDTSATVHLQRTHG